MADELPNDVAPYTAQASPDGEIESAVRRHRATRRHLCVARITVACVFTVEFSTEWFRETLRGSRQKAVGRSRAKSVSRQGPRLRARSVRGAAGRGRMPRHGRRDFRACACQRLPLETPRQAVVSKQASDVLGARTAPFPFLVTSRSERSLDLRAIEIRPHRSSVNHGRRGNPTLYIRPGEPASSPPEGGWAVALRLDRREESPGSTGQGAG